MKKNLEPSEKKLKKAKLTQVPKREGRPDWIIIRAEFEGTNKSIYQIAREQGITRKSIYDRKNKDSLAGEPWEKDETLITRYIETKRKKHLSELAERGSAAIAAGYELGKLAFDIAKQRLELHSDHSDEDEITRRRLENEAEEDPLSSYDFRQLVAAGRDGIEMMLKSCGLDPLRPSIPEEDDGLSREDLEGMLEMIQAEKARRALLSFEEQKEEDERRRRLIKEAEKLETKPARPVPV